MARKRTRHRAHHPVHWPGWLALGLLRGASALPIPWQIGLGRALGRLAYTFTPSRRHIARVNVGICFRDWSEQAREGLVRAHFEALGAGLFETACGWWASDRRLARIGEVRGIEHLQRALEAGRGALLLSGHFTTLEISARLLAMRHPISVMYRPHENPVIEHALHSNRSAHVLEVIAREDGRGMLKALRANHAVWYAPDQSFKGRHSVLAPFCGEPAGTHTATARLAAMRQVPVLPFFGRRVPGPALRYEAEIGPALDGFPSGDLVADTTRVNAIIEAAARRAPEQYFWLHRRFKKRPGLPDPY